MDLRVALCAGGVLYGKQLHENALAAVGKDQGDLRGR